MAAEGKSLKARAAELLSRREYTRQELVRRLAPFADSEDELNAALDELAASNWQSDDRFARQFASSKGTKFGSRRLAQEMRQRGVDSDTIREALSGQDDLASAREQWRKKFGRLPADAAEKARQYRFLAQRGFPADVIRQVLAGGADDDFYED
ncbi:recombination regulator RecX [Chromobacterium violaceum]|uniref:Regulatory protein RecX n=2 Tax=Chromobacterium violaceum TaxID=536 RepID=RECX_CHRVO|nr:recombination regulator RecX [Chromobacterium violaceum]Q7NXM0.1 RecName: Full=Regulatory protein RecX [Chromobacterium violaceum ATCC 12472]AAQ59282.1 regulatory protein RecX [Chromobacterium violaceum ATCC 12472]ATP28243.1 regulatory protein RecX [Chromobacterium violaceum]ATP32151.1 regulatory protein RecX [Chromobacterium violaceum]KJH68719.1 recombinase RecX [Chromobacterium violaceum]KMN51323.1 recombinase RecX [Chromobacterium violaceum]